MMSGIIRMSLRWAVYFCHELVDHYAAEDNPGHLVDVFVGELDLAGLGFKCARLGTQGNLVLDNYV